MTERPAALPPPDPDHDVAFSLLSGDLAIAQALGERLAAFRVWLYTRQTETLLGTDGMDSMADAFRRARLTVILHRDGWGLTPWTAFEETHIKDRALRSRMTSFVVVKLDDSPMPPWIPERHLYADLEEVGLDGVASVIRSRAREQGAAPKVESPIDAAVRRHRAREAAAARQRREQTEANGEGESLAVATFEAIERLVRELSTAGMAIEVERNLLHAVVATTAFSIAVSWLRAGAANGDHARAQFRLNEFDAAARLTAQGPAGSNYRRTTGFVPALDEQDRWGWREAPEFSREPPSPLVVFDLTDTQRLLLPAEMAESVVGRVADRL